VSGFAIAGGETVGIDILAGPARLGRMELAVLE
jgi:hypothetical protein